MERAELKALLRATGCAEERGDLVFLRDPAAPAGLEGMAAAERKTDLGWLCVRTGGSSGGAKYARHDERTLAAAARGFCAHFKLIQVNAVDVLPAFHVSGLMARVRCATTGGTHVPWDWKKLEAGEPPALPSGDWVISLVPTQLQRLMRLPALVAWLRDFRILFIGGGPLWPELAEAAARAGLPLSPGYGMTETAAMVTALRPEEFLAGARTSGSPLPHANVSITPEGLVRIAGESVFRGYYPEVSTAHEFTTEDLGALDERGHLRVLGRRDAVIITGGKKVQPADVEAALRASGEFDDVAVIGVPDAEWGEAVTACYRKSAKAPDFGRAAQALAGHERPKYFVGIPAAHWPRDAQGKINRMTLRVLASGGLPGTRA